MKYIQPEEIGKHITKLQGTVKDTAFAAQVGITRQALRTIKAGGAIPNIRTRTKLGLELTYRVIPIADPVAIAETVPAKSVAKKTAKKK